MPLQTSTESTSDYCLQKATPEGSNLYYACLFEDEPHKQQIIALHAFLTELTTILVECSDPGIARIKLQWWLEELDRLNNQQPRHPVTRCLQQYIVLDAEILKSLKQIVVVTENLLLIEQPDSLSNALNLFRQQAGAICRLCATLSGDSDEKVLNKITDIASSYHYLQAILQPMTYIKESCCLIPNDYINQSALFTEEQITKQHQAQLQRLLNELHQTIDEHLSSLTKSERQKFKYLVILNRIAKKTILKMQASSFPWSSDFVSISPISKLMMAWCIKTSLRF